MSNRFEKSSYDWLRRGISFLPPLFGLLLLILFMRGIHSVGDTTQAKQQESLETALTRSISQCYAVEGFYPPDLAYLEEHYGLTYDKDAFYVDYQPMGTNLMPEVTVIPKSGQN